MQTLLIGLLISMQAYAADVFEGTVVIKNNQGTIIEQKVVLEVPANLAGQYKLGQGEGALSSHATTVVHSHDRAYFKIVFIDPHGNGDKIAMKLVGSFIVSEKAKYFFGNIYSGLFKDMESPCHPDEEGTPHCPTPYYRHTGFFHFKK